MVRVLKIFIIAAVICMLCSCSWWKSYPVGRGAPADLYRNGIMYYQDGKYDKAVNEFLRLKEEYPLSKYAVLAELGVADSYYSSGEYMTAESNYRDFMEFHPTNENLPYTMYQLGMCNYNQMLGIDREQTNTRRAIESFERLMARFPSSKFAFMAEQRLRECKKRMGEHEFYVGYFYFKRGEYRAALSRFENIMQNYANLGLDYKVSYFHHETKRQLEKTEEH
ncbi:MAG: outer membrane protein assembly factor BamD [Syntrophales bacterium]|jgi:outer membrane protein assembly factor BamD|nr:outer membrane protein assembly factor BamD [Syntrophales bacterium]